MNEPLERQQRNAGTIAPKASSPTGPAESQPSLTPPGHLECPATRDSAVRLFIMAAMLIGFGIWCLTDQRPAPVAWDMPHINEAAAYLLNNVGPFLMIPAGLIVGAWAVRRLRRVLVVDETGIGYAGRSKLAWDQITRLDAKSLDKGRLVLHAKRGQVLALDSWKIQGFRELVAVIEHHVPPERRVM